MNFIYPGLITSAVSIMASEKKKKIIYVFRGPSVEGQGMQRAPRWTGGGSWGENGIGGI